MEETETKVINIFPVTKWKRVLLSLADFFITFIIALIFYNLFVYPTFYLANNLDSKQVEVDNAETQISLLLEKNNLLYGDGEDETLSDKLETSFNLFLKEYVEEKPTKTKDVFSWYYLEIRSNQEGYVAIYKDFGEDYFNVIDNAVSLKAELVTLFNPILSSTDGLNEEGNTKYEEMQNKFFLVGYSRILNDIKVNDLTYNSLSYIHLANLIDSFNEKVKKVVTLSSFISFGIGFLINYLLIPIANKGKRTISMVMLKEQIIDTDKVCLIKNGRASIVCLYKLFTSLSMLCFLPLLSIKIEYIFNIPLLLWLSIFSLGMSIVSLVVLLLSQTNQTIADKCTNTAIITNDSLDNIYRNKGYKI